MGSNHLFPGNSQTEPDSRERPTDESALENRISNLGRLVESVHLALSRESFSGKPGALDLVNDLRLKIKANHNMLRVARLLSEPARGSMISRIRDSMNDVEEVVASRFGVQII